jgi:hypothetical protein
LGKGESIKTGIRVISGEISSIDGYITADSDGQHCAEDILRVSEELDAHPGNIILGVRDIGDKNVPRNSKLGNRFSSLLFRLITGIHCVDTQTGLRGFSSDFTDFALSVAGTGYEYEMNLLLASAKMKIPFNMVPIKTVYYQNNRASHFRPIVDSVRVFGTFLKFIASSLLKISGPN